MTNFFIQTLQSFLLTSKGTLSFILAAGVPSRCEYKYVYACSKPTSSYKVKVSSNCSSDSFGYPTIISVVNATFGILSLIRFTKSNNFLVYIFYPLFLILHYFQIELASGYEERYYHPLK